MKHTSLSQSAIKAPRHEGEGFGVRAIGVSYSKPLPKTKTFFWRTAAKTGTKIPRDFSNQSSCSKQLELHSANVSITCRELSA